MEPRGEERTLRSEKVQIERKTFFLDLKENDRGRFLRITEDVGGSAGSYYHAGNGDGGFCAGFG